jgi:hypothetical protein
MGDDADCVRRLLAARVPELSEAEIAEALGESVWLDALAALGDVFGVLEERLATIEQSLTASAARDEAYDHVEDAEDTTTVGQEAEGAFARRVA